MSFAAAGATHQGRRSGNEDAWLVDLDLGLLVLADGMGGHNAGEVASSLAVQTVQAFLRTAETHPDQTRLGEALSRANARILDEATRRPDQAGMGTTAVAVLVSGQRAVYTSVGDSRVYLWHDARLTQLTRDDSWVTATLGEQEAADAQRSGNHPMRHVLTKVVGLRTDLEVSTAECTLTTGDCLLLCSDGVHGALSPSELAGLLAGPEPVATLSRAIVDLAIERGASDNATAIVARLE
jgi:protein phosphatase